MTLNLKQQSDWHVYNSVCFFEREKRYSVGEGGGGVILDKFCLMYHAVTKLDTLIKTKHLYFSLHYFLCSYINFGLVFKKGLLQHTTVYYKKKALYKTTLICPSGPSSTSMFHQSTGKVQ
jgi:hypothetical protein